GPRSLRDSPRPFAIPEEALVKITDALAERGARDAPYFDSAAACLAVSARFAAHRFLVAAMMARRPAAESFRFGFGAGAAAGFFLDSAHLFRCAAAIAALPALLILRRLREGDGFSEATAAGAGLPSSSCRISAIWASIRAFWISNPSIAAVRISVVSFVGMWNSANILLYHDFRRQEISSYWIPGSPEAPAISSYPLADTTESGDYCWSGWQ